MSRVFPCLGTQRWKGTNLEADLSTVLYWFTFLSDGDLLPGNLLNPFWIAYCAAYYASTMLLRCLRHSSGRGSLGNVIQALDQSTGQLFAVKEAHRFPPKGTGQKVRKGRKHAQQAAPRHTQTFFFTKEEVSRACIPLILILYDIMYCDILGINAFMTFHQWAPWVWASFWPLPGLDQHIRCGRC